METTRRADQIIEDRLHIHPHTVAPTIPDGASLDTIRGAIQALEALEGDLLASMGSAEYRNREYRQAVWNTIETLRDRKYAAAKQLDRFA